MAFATGYETLGAVYDFLGYIGGMMGIGCAIGITGKGIIGTSTYDTSGTSPTGSADGISGAVAGKSS